MSNDDIRWHQRLQNYQRALAQLQKAVDLSKTRDLSELEQQGLIQAFEFTHEMAWKVMKDYFSYQGNTSITGSRDAVREAFAVELIADGQGWVDMIKSRNLALQSYIQSVADEMTESVSARYVSLFDAFAVRMEALVHGQFCSGPHQ